MANTDTEEEEICLYGWENDPLPLDAMIGNRTKGEIMKELQSIIELNKKQDGI